MLELPKTKMCYETQTSKICFRAQSLNTCFKAPKRILVVIICVLLCVYDVTTFNVDTKNARIFKGPDGIYFGYSLAMLRNLQGNWLLVGAPKAQDPLQPRTVRSGVLLRCPLEGTSAQCEEVIVDTTGNIMVGGSYYGVTKRFLHDKNNEWLGVAVDVSPSNDRIAVCAHRWKDAKFVVSDALLYMHGLCYELDAGFQMPSRMIPILVDYYSLVHMEQRYPIWAYGALGQSVQYTKNGDALVMGAPGLNDWQGGFVIEDNLRRNYTIQPLADDRRNWMIGYTITTGTLLRSPTSYVIAGAPRANLNGSVFMFELRSDVMATEPLVGDQLGSYFGSTLCAVDVNGDALDDVIVGAPLFSTNTTEEGRVYVYINKGQLTFERQEPPLNGSMTSQGRFGSAIANIGDINKDTFNDIAIGAPYENDGEGTLYIYNGYSGGLWPVFTQKIRGRDIDPGIRAFGAALSPRSVSAGEVFAVGAYDSDNAVVLRVNPVVSMESKMLVRPGIITKTDKVIELVTCFKYTGAATNIPSTLALSYTMRVDTTTPWGSVRGIVVSENLPYVSRDVTIVKNEFVCAQNIMISTPYQDIWRDVEVEVEYELNKAVSDRCTSNCPILEMFDGSKPESSTQTILRKTIQYDKQCGEDNTCETGLTMKLLPLANGGEYIVSGKDRNLEVKVGLMNAGENAYNIIVDVTVAGNLTSIRSPETTGTSSVDCFQITFDSAVVSTFRCRVRKPYPLKTGQEMTFNLLFPLENHMTLSEFKVNFTVRTEEQSDPQASGEIAMPIRSQYGFRIQGLSKPEQVTLGLQQDSNTWVDVEHKYSIKNLGPSTLKNGELLAFVPAIIHRNEALVTNISVWVTTYDTDPYVKSRCYEVSRDAKIPPSESSGGYEITVDCNSFPCRKFACNMGVFKMDQSILVSVNVSVSRQILVRLQARDTIRLASRISLPGVNKGHSMDKEVSTTFHKTTNGMERKKINIPIWLVIVSMVSAFLVLLVIVAILVKVGFFKRTRKEQIKRLRSTRTSPFSKPSDSATASSSNGGIEDTSATYMGDKGHSNPMAEELQNDENEYKQASDNTDAPMRNNAFLSDLNAHLRK